MNSLQEIPYRRADLEHCLRKLVLFSISFLFLSFAYRFLMHFHSLVRLFQEIWNVSKIVPEEDIRPGNSGQKGLALFVSESDLPPPPPYTTSRPPSLRRSVRACVCVCPSTYVCVSVWIWMFGLDRQKRLEHDRWTRLINDIRVKDRREKVCVYRLDHNPHYYQLLRRHSLRCIVWAAMHSPAVRLFIDFHYIGSLFFYYLMLLLLLL